MQIAKPIEFVRGHDLKTLCFIILRGKLSSISGVEEVKNYPG